MLYPVGSVYVSRSAASPRELFGVGEWSKVENRFIYAASADTPVGTLGGENTHVLTVAEMPTHGHAATVASGGEHSHTARYMHFNGISIDSGQSNGYALIRRNQSGDAYHGTASNVAISAGAHTHSASISNVGGNGAHNNMPQFVAYNVWERTA